MDAEVFGQFLARSIEKGGPPINVNLIPQGVKDMIVHMVLMGPHLGPMLGFEDSPAFDFEVNERDEICRIEWSRGFSRTINLIADGEWFTVYQSENGRTSVFRIDPRENRDVDTETMEAVMMIAGVHPTQV